MQFESVARPFEEPEGPGNGRLDGSAGGAPLETAASRDHRAPAGRRRCREPVGWYFKVDKKFTVAGIDGEGVHVLTAPWQRHDSLVPADHEFDWIPVHLGFVCQDAVRQPYQYR